MDTRTFRIVKVDNPTTKEGGAKHYWLASGEGTSWIEKSEPNEPAPERAWSAPSFAEANARRIALGEDGFTAVWSEPRVR